MQSGGPFGGLLLFVQSSYSRQPGGFEGFATVSHLPSSDLSLPKLEDRPNVGLDIRAAGLASAAQPDECDNLLTRINDPVGSDRELHKGVHEGHPGSKRFAPDGVGACVRKPRRAENDLTTILVELPAPGPFAALPIVETFRTISTFSSDIGLLRQPGGFEGSLQVATPLETNHLAVLEGPGVRLLVFDGLALGPTASCRVEANGGDHGIAEVKQFVKFVPVRGKRLTGTSHGEQHFNPAMTNARVGGLGRIHVFDIRGSEVVNEALRIAVDQPLCVNPPNKLDVLLRHRPSSISPEPSEHSEAKKPR